MQYSAYRLLEASFAPQITVVTAGHGLFACDRLDLPLLFSDSNPFNTVVSGYRESATAVQLAKAEIAYFVTNSNLKQVKSVQLRQRDIVRGLKTVIAVL